MSWGNQKPWLGKRVNWADPITKNLVGCWLFNEGAGVKLENLATLGTIHNGIKSGETTAWMPLPGKGMGIESTRTGDITSGHNLGSVTSGDPLSGFGTQALSVASGFIWVDAPANTHVIIEKATGDIAAGGWGLWVEAQADRISFYVDGADGFIQSPNDSLDPPGYHNVLSTAKSPTVKMYIDGFDSGAASGGGAFTFPATTAPANIGQFATGFGFDRSFVGFISYIYVWDRVLSAFEAKRINDDNFCLIEDPYPLNFAAASGLALPIMGTGDIHSTIFGGQVITGG